MKRIQRLICFSILTPILGSGANLSGWLVDSRCYSGMVSGRSGPSETWDGNFEIRYCSPKKKTRAFTLVQQDWSAFKFDPAGDEKAIDLGLNASNKFGYVVDVVGATSRNAVKVERLSVSHRVDIKGKDAPGL